MENNLMNIISNLAMTHLNVSEYTVIFKVLNQTYNNHDEYKSLGDFRAVNSLVSRHILIKESGNKFGNHYHINEHCYEWTKSFR